MASSGLMCVACCYCSRSERCVQIITPNVVMLVQIFTANIMRVVQIYWPNIELTTGGGAPGGSPSSPLAPLRRLHRSLLQALRNPYARMGATLR